jgi:hypothetical protein
MDDDDAIILIFLTFVAAAHQLICSYYIFFNHLPTVKEKKQGLKRKRDLMPYKHNVSCRYSTATNPLEPKNCLADLLQDSNRAYMKSVTHFHKWQFFELAKKLKDLILPPRLCEAMVLGLRYVVNCQNLNIIIVCSSYFDG